MKEKNPLHLFSFSRVFLPLLIGIGVGVLLIAKDFSKPIITTVNPGQGTYYWIDANHNQSKELQELHPACPQHKGNINVEKQTNILSRVISSWTWQSTLCLFIAMMFAVSRDFMYMYRIRLLSDKKISWYHSFQVIMLWEFGSAVTPSVVGGSALAFFIVGMEGIGVGRSTAIVMITALLDELFYIIIAPLAILFAGINVSFIRDFDFSFLGAKFGMISVFFIGYGFMCLLTIFILLAVFVYPKAFKRFLYSIGRKRIFKKWKDKLEKTGDDIITSSEEFKGKSLWFWIKAYGCTVLSWTSRFLVVNFILLAFTPVGNHLLVYARQLVMWIILCISPTPGSSGIAEFCFPIFFREFLPLGLSSTIAVIWRLYTYYPYLFLGLIVLPIWSRRVFHKSKKA